MWELVRGKAHLAVPLRVSAGRVGANRPLCPRPYDGMDGHALRLGQQVPQREVDTAQGHHSNALATVRDGLVVESVPGAEDVVPAIELAPDKQVAHVPVDDLDRRFAAAAISESDLTGVRLHTHHNLPQMRPPRWRDVFVVRIDGLHVGDVHGSSSWAAPG